MARWLTLRESAEYIRKSPRFVLREVRAGRLRAARIGGRGEVLSSVEWLDAYIEAQAKPVPVVPFRKVS